MFKKTNQANPAEAPEELQDKDLDQVQGGAEQLALNFEQIRLEYNPRPGT